MVRRQMLSCYSVLKFWRRASRFLIIGFVACTLWCESWSSSEHTPHICQLRPCKSFASTPSCTFGCARSWTFLENLNTTSSWSWPPDCIFTDLLDGEALGEMRESMPLSRELCSTHTVETGPDAPSMISRNCHAIRGYRYINARLHPCVITPL